MTESVNHPSHYNNGDIECIDAIHAALGDEGFLAFCQGNVLKYNWRAGLKGDRLEDLKKAQWYQARMVNLLSLLTTEIHRPGTKKSDGTT
jgi:hypothetical protein